MFSRLLRLRRLRNIPLWWWICALATGLLFSVFMGYSAWQAEENAKRLGGLVSVPIATRFIPMGSLIEPEDIESAQWPRALLPQADIAPIPVGIRSTANLYKGEPVLAEKLAPGGLSAISALLLPGERSIDVPHPDTEPNVEVGDVVDVIDDKGTVITKGRVLAKSENSTTIATDKRQLGQLATSISGDKIVLAVVPHGEEQANPSPPADD